MFQNSLFAGLLVWRKLLISYQKSCWLTFWLITNCCRSWFSVTVCHKGIMRKMIERHQSLSAVVSEELFGSEPLEFLLNHKPVHTDAKSLWAPAGILNSLRVRRWVWSAVFPDLVCSTCIFCICISSDSSHVPRGKYQLLHHFIHQSILSLRPKAQRCSMMPPACQN